MTSLPTSASGQRPAMDTVRECSSESLRHAAARLEGRRCFESAAGWFLTPDSVWASRASTAIRIGAARFQQIFGDTIGRGVVLQVPDTTSLRTPNDSLRTVFSHAAWTWNSPVQLNPAQSPAEQLQAFSGLERHEMGHHWFDLWGKRHGGKDTLPSWMVESPAILMEDSAMTAIRYANLKTLPAQAGGLIPLEELFVMANPVVRATNQGADTDPQDIMRGEVFYDECRAFFDFLLARTGDPRVFGAIALQVIHGATVADWLRANGSRYRLPTTVGGLDQEWQSWLP